MIKILDSIVTHINNFKTFIKNNVFFACGTSVLWIFLSYTVDFENIFNHIFLGTEKNKNQEKKTETPYETIYLEKLKKIQESNDGNDGNNGNDGNKQPLIQNINAIPNLDNSLLMEKTPSGLLLMFYHNKNNSFHYYSNNSVQTKHLHSAAMKYITMFGCIWILDQQEHISNMFKQKEKEEEEKNKQTTQQKDNCKKVTFDESASDKLSTIPKKTQKKGLAARRGVIANLKKNISGTGTGTETHTDTDTDTEKDQEKEGEKEIREPILDKIQLFTFNKRGIFNDFSVLQKRKTTHSTSNTNPDTQLLPKTNIDKSNLSFAEFKKLKTQAQNSNSSHSAII